MSTIQFAQGWSWERARRRGGRVLGLVVGGAVIVVLLLFPLYWVIVSSFQNLGTLFAAPPSLFPLHWILSNYVNSFGSIIGNIGVSVLVSVSVVCLTWLIAVPAGHAVARLGGWLSQTVVLVMLITQMIPGISLALAFYQLFHRWGLLGSYVGLILADTTYGVPFAVLVLRAFMASIPGELYEAASLDGAGGVRSFLRITLPLAGPAIATVGVFTFLFAWGDFVNALTLNGASGVQPLTLGLYKFTTEHETNIGAIFAATTVAAVPTTILLFVAQRWIRGGIKAGALKG